MTSSLRAALATLATIAAVAFGFGTSQATSPPESWTNERIIQCDGTEIHAFLTPGGFGTPFNLVGSNAVIIPKFVLVTIEGTTFLTVDVPGFDPEGANAVHCMYVDPRGFLVDFRGLRTPAPH
jgi:hypothetical protein